MNSTFLISLIVNWRALWIFSTEQQYLCFSLLAAEQERSWFNVSFMSLRTFTLHSCPISPVLYWSGARLSAVFTSVTHSFPQTVTDSKPPAHTYCSAASSATEHDYLHCGYIHNNRLRKGKAFPHRVYFITPFFYFFFGEIFKQNQSKTGHIFQSSAWIRLDTPHAFFTRWRESTQPANLLFPLS